MSAAGVILLVAAGLAAFAFALAVQVRILAGVALRKALTAKQPALDDVQARSAVAWAAGSAPPPEGARPWLEDAVAHLRQTYPRPLGHVRLARRVTLAAPVVALALLGVVRFGGL